MVVLVGLQDTEAEVLEPVFLGFEIFDDATVLVPTSRRGQTGLLALNQHW